MPQTYCRDDPVSGRWSGVNRLLTEYEVDDNFYTLIQRVVTLENNESFTVSISYITLFGLDLTFHMTDHTTQGPFIIPVATFRDRGTWAASTSYLVNDTFSINGTLYLVIFAHVSALTFDPGANDGLGHNYYSPMLTIPGSSLPTGGAAGMMLYKVDGHDFNVAWKYPVPVGGTTGQLLAKSSGTDFAMSWIDSDTLGFISVPPPSPAGAPGQMLETVDGTATSTRWVTPSSGVTSLAGLTTDVLIVSPQQYDHLEFDGTKWANEQRGQIDIGTVSGSHAIDPLSAAIYTITPSGAVTITSASAAPPGFRVALKIVTSGTTSYDVTFGSGMKTSGDVFTGIVSGQVFTIDFVMDLSGTLCEVGRSAPALQTLSLDTTGAVTLDPTLDGVFTLTPTGAVTLNASSVPIKRITIIVTTSGGSSFAITFGTSFKSTGVLNTGTASGKVFTISFVGDGTNMNENGRTVAM